MPFETLHRGSAPEGAMRGDVELILRRAGVVALAAFRGADVHKKLDGSAVTDADRACEGIIVSELARRFPDDGVVGEEGAVIEPRKGGALWYVDPIDGTGAFLEGLAHWGPTICRVRDGRVEVGGLYLPRLDELWFAARGGGAWRDRTRLEPTFIEELDSLSALYVPSSAHREWNAPIASWPGRTRGLGSSAAHLALVASGAVSATIIDKFQPWDVGAGLLMLHEVRLPVVGIDGSPIDPIRHPGRPFAAGQPIALAHLTKGHRPG